MLINQDNRRDQNIITNYKSKNLNHEKPIFSFFILLIVSCSNNSETEYLISDEKVYLKVGTNTSEEELVKISTE